MYFQDRKEVRERPGDQPPTVIFTSLEKECGKKRSKQQGRVGATILKMVREVPQNCVYLLLVTNIFFESDYIYLSA